MTRHEAAEPRRLTDALSYLVLAGCIPVGAAVGYLVAGPLVAAALAVLLGVAFVLTAVSRLSETATTWDRATGLPDREATLLGLESLIARRAALRAEPAVIVVRVVSAEASAAHQATLLLRAAPRLAEELRQGDQISRVSEQGFAVILTPTRGLDRPALGRILKRIEHAFSEWDEDCTIAIGACQLADIAIPKPADWLAAAEDAAERSAVTGEPEIFDAAGVGTVTFCDLVDEIEEAIESGQIVAFLQPQIDARSDRITAFEALARWQHPRHGLLDPALWLPAVASRGLDKKLLLRMVSEVCRTAAAWSERGYLAPGFGVNASMRALSDPALAGEVAWLLERHDFGAGRLHIELTENVTSEGVSSDVARTLAALTGLGCRIELDDVRRGETPVAEMLRTGARRIKIDQSAAFLDDSMEAELAALREIVARAHNLGAEALAKRVETAEQRELALSLGFDGLQGFHLAEPMPADEAIAWALDHEQQHAGETVEPVSTPGADARSA